MGLHPAGALFLLLSACLAGQWAGCLGPGHLTSPGGWGHQSGPAQAGAGAQLRQPGEGGGGACSQGPVIMDWNVCFYLFVDVEMINYVLYYVLQKSTLIFNCAV